MKLIGDKKDLIERWREIAARLSEKDPSSKQLAEAYERCAYELEIWQEVSIEENMKFAEE